MLPLHAAGRTEGFALGEPPAPYGSKQESSSGNSRSKSLTVYFCCGGTVWRRFIGLPLSQPKVDPRRRTECLGLRHYIPMTANSVSRIVMYVSEVNDAYRRENAILRTLLLEQGLSQRKLASELRKRQRTLQAKESSEQTLKRVVSEALDFLAKQDAAVLALLEDRIEDDHSKMH